MALGAASLGLAYIRLGPFNLVVGLAIAAMQIGIIGLFFMKLRHARSLIALTASAAFIFVFVMCAFTFNDLFTRH
jgi:cytochrome c oxidase subunit IV